MRLYRGRRDESPSERAYIEVYDDQTGRSYPIVEVPARHTAGLEWGFSGTGPHNAARAILADYLGEIPFADVVAFEQEVIASRKPHFDLPASWIEACLAARRRADENAACAAGRRPWFGRARV